MINFKKYNIGIRDIKFKYYFHHQDTMEVISKVFTLVELANLSLREFMEEEIPEYYFLAKAEYTGLTDKNQKEIYEGCIIKIKSLSSFKIFGDTEDPSVVVWDGACFAVEREAGTMSIYPSCTNEDYEVKVIGNVFEDGNLIKK